jgi:hypothetical protein
MNQVIVALKKQFVSAVEEGNLEQAQSYLEKMYEVYGFQGGFETMQEKIEFEAVVVWLDQVLENRKEVA